MESLQQPGLTFVNKERSSTRWGERFRSYRLEEDQVRVRRTGRTPESTTDCELQDGLDDKEHSSLH